MGCQSSEKKSVRANQAPRVVSAAFFPTVVYQRNALMVETEGFDPENATLSYRFEWSINNKTSTHHKRSLPTGLLKRGDRVSVKVIPNDGLIDGKPFQSDVIVVQNRPPEIVSIQLLPQPFRPGEIIEAVVTAIDLEGDEVFYDYEWKKNGQSLFAANMDKLKIEDLKKGDTVSVRVTPSDQNEWGKAVESLNLASGNRPPAITSNPPDRFENGVYTYSLKATDPDGDTLKYSIRDPQPGMTFHATGLFQWKIPDTTSGVQHVTLVVMDPEGTGKAQKLRLDIDYLRTIEQ
ncbi:hypothetical protein JYT87_00125 [Nitrospira defluvii]|nr:hypothetical protein [Nitrospira defluvii]